MCLYGKIIFNPKYKPNKKNGGLVPPLYDKRVLGVPIGCGLCIECRKQKAREWQCRLLEDIKEHKNGKFITLTFNTESLKKLGDETPLTGYDRDNYIATRATRLFLERWRKKYKRSVRHWFVTELGHQNTEHMHIHGIIWTDHCKHKDRHGLTLKEINDVWQYGWIYNGTIERGRRVNYVNDSTISYMIKYVNKMDMQHQRYKPIILCSAGIGRNYTKGVDSRTNKFKEAATEETYRTRSGHKIAMPIYWRNKIYTDDQKEMLWLHKMNKQERWICGERVSTAKGDAEYYKVLEHYRRLNKQLGYGTPVKAWKREIYEKERRNLIWDYRTKGDVFSASPAGQ